MGVVDKILRVCWKIDLLEELESPGELTIEVNAWQMQVLLAGGTYLHESPGTLAHRLLFRALETRRDPKSPPRTDLSERIFQNFQDRGAERQR